MTLQQYIESISLQFPQKGQTEITSDVNSALREFIDRTKILRDVIRITRSESADDHYVTVGLVGARPIDGIAQTDGTGITTKGRSLTVYESPALSGRVTIDYPKQAYAVKGIRAWSEDGRDLSYRISYDIYDGKIFLINGTGSSPTLPYDVETVEVEILIYNDELADLGDSPSIPHEFHRAVEAAVLERYYRRTPIVGGESNSFAVNLAMAKSMKDEWDSAIIKAKQMYYTNRDMGQASSAISDF